MVDGIQNLGSLIGQTSADATSQSQTQAMYQDVGSSYFTFANYGQKILNTNVLVEIQSIGTAAVWGNSTNGIWGTMLWGGSFGSFSTVYSSSISQNIPDSAISSVVSWLSGNSVNQPTYVALGTGNTPYSQTQTTLVSEFYRTSFDTYDTSTDTILNSQYNINSVATALQGTAFKEVGSFNASSNGTMFSRYVIPSITLNNLSNYRFTVQTTIFDNSLFNSISPTSGLNAMRNWLGGNSINPPAYTTWGTGTTKPNITDTTLEGEEQRNIFGSIRLLNNSVTYETLLTYSQANSKNISKSGLFDTSSLGTLWFEQLMNPIAKANTFQIDDTSLVTII